MKKSPELKSKQLIIKPLDEAALRAKIGNIEDEELKMAYGEMLSLSLAHPEDRLWYTAWGFAFKETPDEIIGDLCFKGPQKNGAVEIGYGIKEEYENKGYTTEAAKRLIEWAFDQTDVYMIYAETDKDNKASMRVLEKLDFKYDGEGIEGPRFLLLKQQEQMMPVYMCLGVAIGASFGVIFSHIAIGMCLGIGVGVAIGALIDQAERKHRDKVIGETGKKNDK